MSRSHKPQENTPHTHSIDGRRLNKLHFLRSEGEGGNLLFLTGIEPRIFCRPAQRHYPGLYICKLKLWPFKIWVLRLISRNRDSVVGRRIRLRDGRSRARFPAAYLRFFNRGYMAKTWSWPHHYPVLRLRISTDIPLLPLPPPVYLIYPI